LPEPIRVSAGFWVTGLSGFDLAGGDPRRLHGLDAEVAEGDGLAALRHAVEAAALLLAVLGLPGHQHQSFSLRKCGTS
jgi:hypothetical protein